MTCGLALGIDGYAHDGALYKGGETFAVLGSGLDSIYSARHRNLADRICENGALISESVQVANLDLNISLAVNVLVMAYL